MARRDPVARETDHLFASAIAGRLLTTARADVIREMGTRWAVELEESQKNPEAWHRKVTGHEPFEDDLTGRVDMLSASDLLDEEVEHLTREHGNAAADRFLNIVHGRVDVEHHLEDYLREAGLASKTTRERSGLVKLFARWAAGRGLSIVGVNRGEAGRYVTSTLVPMNRRTASKHLTALSQYWSYLIRRGHVEGPNPWKDQLLPDNKRRVERGDLDGKERAFTTKELQALLYPPAPTKRGAVNWQLMQDVMCIGALSGMREAEIITLWASDVGFADNGEATFHLQHGKNPNAARPVPVHTDLMEIVKRRLKGKSGTDLLFPELVKSKNPADTFGKRFRTYREGRGVDDKREDKRRSLVNFHSFRRWFVTEAERAGQQEAIISAVVGHEEGRKSITLSVYSSGPSEDQKRRCVEAVRLPAQATAGQD